MKRVRFRWFGWYGLVVDFWEFVYSVGVFVKFFFVFLSFDGMLLDVGLLVVKCYC